jgi:hypothetical protein
MTWQGVDITTCGPALSIWPPVLYALIIEGYFKSVIT